MLTGQGRVVDVLCPGPAVCLSLWLWERPSVCQGVEVVGLSVRQYVEEQLSDLRHCSVRGGLRVGDRLLPGFPWITGIASTLTSHL